MEGQILLFRMAQFMLYCFAYWFGAELSSSRSSSKCQAVLDLASAESKV
jgi:hypothetical protein